VKNKASPAPEPIPALSKGLRRYLFLTAATTGAAIMVVEILGAKMLSPFVGLSHFVWTAQIAVTLVALACGYYAGGRLADRSPKLTGLYWAILAAAAYLAITVLACERVAYWALDFSLPVGTLLASTTLFFVPLGLLAMTGPFLVRVITSTVTGVGGNVGRLTSISTLGSFVGTLLTGYLLIPLLPNSATMYVTAAILVVVCLGYFGFFHNKHAVVSVAVAVGALIGVGLYSDLHGPATRQHNRVVEKFRGNSFFGRLQVVEEPDGSSRYYLNDNLYQNTYDTKQRQSESAFTYLLSGLARAYTTNISDVLCIGLGVGIVPMDFARQGARVDVVEINPAVVPIAVRFFDLDRSKLNLTIDDGRHFLNRCGKKYDVVVLDAFLGDSSPSHLMTKEAFTAMRRVLRPGGTLVINSFGKFEAGRDFFTSSLNQTLKAVFQGVRIHTFEQGNVLFVATDRPEPEFVHPPELTNIHERAWQNTRTAYYEVVGTVPGHGRVLTDDFNPAEYYDAQNREEIRKGLARAARDM
jgi:spermidine synthase